MGADEQIWLSPRRKNPAASSCCATAAGCLLTARTDLEAFQQPFSSSAGGTVCLLCCRHVLRAELIHQIVLFQPGKKNSKALSGGNNPEPLTNAEAVGSAGLQQHLHESHLPGWNFLMRGFQAGDF